MTSRHGTGPVRTPGRRILRLWWRCRRCRWRLDTFGISHDNEGDRRALGDEVLDHLAQRHPQQYSELWTRGALTLSEVAATFEPAGSARPRKPHVLVPR